VFVVFLGFPTLGTLLFFVLSSFRVFVVGLVVFQL